MDLIHDRDYWETGFEVRRVDLDRIARRMQRTVEASDLTALTRRLIRGRLRYGPEPGSRLMASMPERPEVWLWDPSAAWHEGDQAIFAVPALRYRVRAFVPAVGQIVKVQGNGVVVRIDGRKGTRLYGAATRARGNPTVDRWRRSVEDLVAVLEDRTDEPSRIDYILWRYGPSVVTVLLHALRADERFVTLSGAWFLAELVTRPTEGQLVGLARTMLWAVDGAMTTADLRRLMPSFMAEGAAGTFGLDAAMRERPDLFTNVDAGPRSRWTLSGPPPGAYTARLAAYDPEHYTILCEPGKVLSPEVVQRLWDLNLLGTVVERSASRT